MADEKEEPITAVVVAQSTALTPMEMLGRALDRDADLSVIEKLMDLQERHERNVGRKAFDAAIADAKAEIKPVTKNRTGHNNKKYADMAAFAKEVDPVLAKHGLNYRFRTSQDGAISVTCILSHRDGHSEETTLQGAADTTGNKNSIQAIGSTLTYLQRYSLTAALGLAATEDDDGQSAGGDEKISDEQLAALRKRIDATEADTERLCNALNVPNVTELRKSQYKDAEALLIEREKILAKKKASK